MFPKHLILTFISAFITLCPEVSVTSVSTTRLRLPGPKLDLSHVKSLAPSIWHLAPKGWQYIGGILEQMKAGPGHQEDTLGELSFLVKIRVLAFRGIACTPQPGHQGPQTVLTRGWAAAFSEPISASLPSPSISTGARPRLSKASASAQLSVAQWAVPTKEESYFYLFLLNHELNLAANQVTMVTCTGFIAVS